MLIFRKVKKEVHIAAANPENFEILDFVRKKTGFEPRLFLASPADIKNALKGYDKRTDGSLKNIIEVNAPEQGASEEQAEKITEQFPTIELVNNIFEKAIAANASDIHIEPAQQLVNVRYRIDGILHKIAELPKELLPSVDARIKIMANMKIDEHMKPQDGRIHYNYHDQKIAIRVSIIPTLYGAKIALRLLEMNQKMFTLKKLGLNKKDFQLIKKEINLSQGMILVTGPTGSGKTTTLYTLLKMLNREGVNISTIEDPIEYGLENVNQMQIKPSVGLTFASGLRSMLRQDPNIIMIGEIRDTETAQIAVNAAMTGHLVLSTLHTNSAFLTPQRLIEIGVAPYLVNSVINLLIGQRLVRKLCPKCKIKIRMVDKTIKEYEKIFPLSESYKKILAAGLLPKGKKINQSAIYRPGKCSYCNNTGFKGRVGIYEIIKVDRSLRKLILKDSSEISIKNHVLKNNILTMCEDGLLKMFQGQTTFEEIIRVTKE